MQFSIHNDNYLQPLFPSYQSWKQLGMLCPDWSKLHAANAIVYRPQGGEGIEVTLSVKEKQNQSGWDVEVYPRGMSDWPVPIWNFRWIDIDANQLLKAEDHPCVVRLVSDVDPFADDKIHTVRVPSLNMSLGIVMNNMVLDGTKGKLTASPHSWFLMTTRDVAAVFDWTNRDRPRVVAVHEIENLERDFEEIEVLGDYAKFYIGKQVVMPNSGQLYVDYTTLLSNY